MRTLLLGGSRFVGMEIAWQLLRAGHDLSVLSLDPLPPSIAPHVRWLHADRNDQERLTATFAGQSFDCVVDNIAYTPAHVGLLASVLSGRIGRYLLTSTTDAYPKNFPRVWHEEEVEIRELDMEGVPEHARYGLGKRSAEARLARAGVPWTVIRPCMVLGAKDNVTSLPYRGTRAFEQGGRSHFWISRLLDGGPIIVCSEDELVYSAVWAGDVGRAVVHLLGHPDAVGQAYNVAGDEIWSNERLVRAIAQALGKDPEIVHVPAKAIVDAGFHYDPMLGTAPCWTLFNTGKLKATGWRPTPASTWLRTVVEAAPERDYRKWYHTRLQEIALARHVQRRRATDPVFTSLPAAPTADRTAIDARPESRLAGEASPAATGAWLERIRQQRNAPSASTFYRDFGGRLISAVGIGTWMGDMSPTTSARYIEALVHGAARGLNVFDTAINYRHMVAERTVGAALRRLACLGFDRRAFLVCTKGGYFTGDAHDARAGDQFMRDEYLDTGLVNPEELARRHGIGAALIVDQLSRSRTNLGLETVDLYYLHNPEDELPHLGEASFYERLRDTFGALEEAVARRQIRAYGLATWDGLRVPPGHPKHLSLGKAVAMAEAAAIDAGNARHNLRAVQLPLNVQHTAAVTEPTQQVGRQQMTAIAACHALELYVFTSASLLQGAQIPADFQPAIPGFGRHAAALAAVVATPNVGTALVGMRSPERVEQALGLASLDLASLSDSLATRITGSVQD